MTAPALTQRGVADRGSTPAAARQGWRRDLTGWAFAAPFVILFGVFLALPILVSFLMSFTSFGLRDLQNPIGTTVVGVDNYARLLSDGKFWKALGNTFYFVVVGVPAAASATPAVSNGSSAICIGTGTAATAGLLTARG